jgi:hypothetical protein
MIKRSRPSEKMHRWRISRIRSTPAVEIGYIDAPDAEKAVAEAIKRYEISDPHDSSRSG